MQPNTQVTLPTNIYLNSWGMAVNNRQDVRALSRTCENFLGHTIATLDVIYPATLENISWLSGSKDYELMFVPDSEMNTRGLSCMVPLGWALEMIKSNARPEFSDMPQGPGSSYLNTPWPVDMAMPFMHFKTFNIDRASDVCLKLRKKFPDYGFKLMSEETDVGVMHVVAGPEWRGQQRTDRLQVRLREMTFEHIRDVVCNPDRVVHDTKIIAIGEDAKPCAFCGSSELHISALTMNDVVLHATIKHSKHDLPEYKCGVEMRGESVEAVYAMWNKRPSPIEPYAPVVFELDDNGKGVVRLKGKVIGTDEKEYPLAFGHRTISLEPFGDVVDAVDENDPSTWHRNMWLDNIEGKSVSQSGVVPSVDDAADTEHPIGKVLVNWPTSLHDSSWMLTLERIDDLMILTELVNHLGWSMTERGGYRKGSQVHVCFGGGRSLHYSTDEHPTDPVVIGLSWFLMMIDIERDQSLRGAMGLGKTKEVSRWPLGFLDEEFHFWTFSEYEADEIYGRIADSVWYSAKSLLRKECVYHGLQIWVVTARATVGKWVPDDFVVNLGEMHDDEMLDFRLTEVTRDEILSVVQTPAEGAVPPAAVVAYHKTMKRRASEKMPQPNCECIKPRPAKHVWKHYICLNCNRTIA